MKREHKTRLGSLEIRDLSDLLRSALIPTYAGLTTFLILLDFWVIFTRPQANISPLAVIRFPFLVTALAVLFSMSKFSIAWSKQASVISFFLLLEALRILVGSFVFPDLVRNDRYAFWFWFDIAFLLLGLILPLGAYLNCDRSISKFSRIWCFAIIYLGIYAITHGGRGPEGYLGDENDMAYQLVVMLPLPIIFFMNSNRQVSRSLLFFSVIVGSAGVVATFSRGGFVGYVAVMGALFLRIRRKALFAGIGVLLLLFSIPFLPQGYIDEMRSVQHTNEGTAATRRHFWAVAMRIFYDPHWTIQGVGMGNNTFHLSSYETAEDTANNPSIAGRAVHSIYVQLLADLGLWGVFIIGSLVFGSARGNRRTVRNATELLKRLQRFEQIAFQTIEGDKDRRILFSRIKNTLENYSHFSSAMNISFFGVFSAGAFLSTLYYPQLWLIAGLSGAVSAHARRFIPIAETFLERLEKDAFVKPAES